MLQIGTIFKWRAEEDKCYNGVCVGVIRTFVESPLETSQNDMIVMQWWQSCQSHYRLTNRVQNIKKDQWNNLWEIGQIY